MWVSDIFRGLDAIRQDCTVAPTPDMAAAAQQALTQTANLCTSARSGQAQVARQAIAAGLVVGILVGHYLWKR